MSKKLDEYEKLVKGTRIYPKKIGKLYTALGLAGEAGEVAEKIKKLYRDGSVEFAGELLLKPSNLSSTRESILKELGDVLWYVTSLGMEFGITLEDIMDANMEKLSDRKDRNVLHGSGDNR